MKFDRILLRHAVRLAFAFGADDWSGGPRAPDTAHLRASGVDPLRVLLFGGGASAGYGVNTHELALAGSLARRVSTITHRAIDLDVAVAADFTIDRAEALVGTVTPSAYDAILVSIGMQDALEFAAPTRWGQGLALLIDSLRADGASPPEVIVLAIPPLSRVIRLPPRLASFVDRHVEALNAEAAAVLDGLPCSTYLPFMPPERDDGDRDRSPATYDRWAAVIAPGISDVLSGLSAARNTTVDEAARQGSLDRLRIIDSAPEEAFDRIARLAKDLFGTQSAAISFIDGNRQWFKSSEGCDLTETARSVAFCDHTIRQTGSLVVPNATLDPRFADNPFVNDDTHLRFYAGYPIEGTDGQRIGALCVFDNVERSFTDTDNTLLRNLALLVQEQLALRMPALTVPPVTALTLPERVEARQPLAALI